MTIIPFCESGMDVSEESRKQVTRSKAKIKDVSGEVSISIEPSLEHIQ